MAIICHDVYLCWKHIDICTATGKMMLTHNHPMFLSSPQLRMSTADERLVARRQRGAAN